MIKAKINVSKIVKDKLFIGQQGTYLDLTLLENRDGTDQYGNDGFIVQDFGKEAREAGQRGPIIGNYKILNRQQPQQRQKQNSKSPASNPVAGDVPHDSDNPPF